MQQRENRLFLTSGLGASYLLTAMVRQKGSAGAVGCEDHHGATFNDMPGTFDDKLELSVRPRSDIQKHHPACARP